MKSFLKIKHPKRRMLANNYHPNAESLRYRRRKRHESHFEDYAAEGNRILNEIGYELSCDNNKAMRVLRCVIHALRDRLTPGAAIHFAQGLPMALKAIFIDQYDLSKTPVVIRSPHKFLEFIAQKEGPNSYADFPDEHSVLEALQAVFFVLENHMDYGQVLQLKHNLNKEIVDMIESF
jgi:uncharacterized protein (DUF2267 family)